MKEENDLRMERRRVNFSFGVIYETVREKLQAIPKIVEDIITEIENTEFDRTHFASYERFSLQFLMVYYVQSADYKEYMDIQEEINLRLKEEFKKQDIEFAYPTQMIYMKEPAIDKMKNKEKD